VPLKLRLTSAWLLGVALPWQLLGCGPSVEQQTNDERAFLSAPSRSDFPDVGNAVQLRCGTLDCHGQVGRNLRLYGYGGLRLSASETPNADPTTNQELDACYASLVGLEPETLSEVVTLRADPNQLSLVRKMRGIERHKGGQQSRQGDALDRCVVRWLTAQSDPAACAEVISAPNPGNE
jgi:hypothetical protein